MDVPMDGGRMEVIKLMTHQFEFLSHIYGKEKIKNSFGVYIKSGAKLEEDNKILDSFSILGSANLDLGDSYIVYGLNPL